MTPCGSPTLTRLQEAAEAAAELLVFRGILAHPVALAWQELMQQLAEGDPLPCLAAYGRWFELLAQQNLSWREWLIQTVRLADNPFSRAALRPDGSPTPLRQAAAHDLRCLQTLADSQEAIWEQVQALGLGIHWLDGEASTGWDPRRFSDWGLSLEELIAHYRQAGVGLCGQYRAFRWDPAGLQGIPAPDLPDWDWIYGNERQKQRLAANTEALIQGRSALHVLLYGARGTGKSSLVKALLGRYGAQGLRLLELNRSDLIHLPEILLDLRERVLPFILFVDDLSFEADETDFKQLKVLLEGDIAAQPPNVRLYATTNRRHLIREFFPDRPNPEDQEVHAWDTVQEKLSLRDRFGLTLTFTPFTQADYFATVAHLADKLGLAHDPEALRRHALIWAQQQNGFSGRTARQFLDAVRAGLVKIEFDQD
ncbi:ATP-binding protein [Synechococcus sp. Nb3U1]|uniref:ATP-binding protein n=1 Tax=Synechococcus sp. Nb3U1 TaxID=1914529 RepID=UPI001F42ADFD|nr:ATP-binding protein [Synechococcus sp. Nb3U1]MCF2971052.1 ATP-binding protein [Synechococcus sp. Nb3U1]